MRRSPPRRLLLITLSSTSSSSTTTTPVRSRCLTTTPTEPAPPLTLAHFIQRQRVLALYRQIVRGVRRGAPQQQQQQQRAAALAYARAEFARNRHVRDVDHIRYLVAAGEAEWRAARRYLCVEELAGR